MFPSCLSFPGPASSISSILYPMEVDRHMASATLSPLDSEEITTLLRAEIECQNRFLCIQNTVSMIPYGHKNGNGGRNHPNTLEV